MHALVTSPKSRGQLVSLLSGFIAALALTVIPALPVAAQQAASGDLPVMFDARERLPRPDLSNVPRIRALTTVDFPPFSFIDQTGRLTGFHVDFIREICAELKVEAKCQIQAMPYADLEPALEKSGAELVLAGVAVTPDLRRRFSFSRPYMLLPARFAVSKRIGLTEHASVALSGRPVGVVAGTVHETMLKNFFAKVQMRPFENPDAMLDALKHGSVDAVFADGLRLPFWVASEASGGCCALFDGPYMSQRYLGEGLSAMFRHNDTVLPAAFDSAVAALSRNGRLQEIYQRYFPNGLY
ncbi:transporter substrate-binding domain-containing protein [Rhizobiales bacterium RZME27]|uniref:Transporter substrate-binding domain-containing protein n=1 Tax=Endobacterium cereale TaxID=2663029 RepID=A0A6A8A6K6_9HYPH|nr:transporter substrate-binding domain-containing protein [Endobacterium cereale]MEB2844700.1 transporter substrate-binding domain-containing protein [Endobacterium cereale]MQY45477.1 transporter substrate-binding domain-containing protein [Endobacterium cereale]